MTMRSMFVRGGPFSAIHRWYFAASIGEAVVGASLANSV